MWSYLRKLLKSATKDSPKSACGNDIDYDAHVDFYYSNLINSLILFTYNGEQLDAMTPVLIDPLTELYEEIDYAYTAILFETIFKNGLIDFRFKDKLLEFKEKVELVPSEIWDWEFLDSNSQWLALREKANAILDELGIGHRDFDSRYHSTIGF